MNACFLRKFEQQGRVLFEEIPNIPKSGERVEDVGLYKRSDLKPTENLKPVFKSIRNFLAANAVGATRDEVFAQQLINIIFCKIYDERYTKPDDKVSFRAGLAEEKKVVAKRVKQLFANVKDQYPDVIEKTDQLTLDDQSIHYIVGELQLYCLAESGRDAIGEAFETFIGPSLKGGQGQFFTPRNVINLLVRMANPVPGERIIDPACGSGGFLIESAKFLWDKIQMKGEELHWPDLEIATEKQKLAIDSLRGIDKDYFLAKVAKAYMAVIGDGRGGIFCENSLSDTSTWSDKARSAVVPNSFDVVLTNPPFGKKLKVKEEDILKSFNLGSKWKKKTGTNVFEKSDTLHDGQAPQILFVEHCLNLLKKNGRLSFIAPESMFCNPSHRYIMQFIEAHARVKAVVSFPEELFQPYTHAKACGVLIEKAECQDHDEIFMAVAKWCGHDSRGLEIPHDDIPQILENYKRWAAGETLEYDHLGFTIKRQEIIDNVYLPKYYNPELSADIQTLTNSHELVRFGDLVESGDLEVSTGHEVGKLAYGTGSIPFIRTSDIANWEIKLDPKHGLSENIYSQYASKQDVQANDILMVRDGTYLVGTCAIVTERDTKIVYQSHIYKIRSLTQRIPPHLLLAILSSPIVKRQIYAKRFTQDIIDTLGQRLHELILPLPKEKVARQNIEQSVRKILENKLQARDETFKVITTVAPVSGGEELSSEEAQFLTLIG